MKTILLPGKNNIQNAKSFAAKQLMNRFAFVLIGSTLMSLANAQDKRLVMAEKYFAAGEYYTAAGLYGQYLKPDAKTKAPTNFPLNSKRYSGGSGSYGSKTDILYRQAESYRLANYWTEAAELYKECFEKDAAKYAAAMYWYAVSQRSLGNYNEAEETINRFLKENGEGNNYHQAAEKEKQTIVFIKKQLARPDSSMFHVNKIKSSFTTQKGIYAPVSSIPNRFIITSTQQTDTVAAGQTPYHNRLFSANYNNNSLESIELLPFESLDPSFNQGAASISSDGKFLYFTQWKKDTGQVAAIYYATKTANGWSKPVYLNSVNEKGHNSQQPHSSADGKYLYFSSDRTGGQGGFDIWYAPINADGTTADAVNAGSMLNSSSNEQAPFYHNGATTLVFSSDRMPGMGGYDLFMAKRNETDWKVAENMGHPVNSSRDDVYFYSAGDGALLNNAFFSSDRGAECCLETYSISKTAKKKMITGVINDCWNNDPLADAVVILKDANGNTRQFTTNADGRYSFDWNTEGQHQIFVSKEKYVEKNADIAINGKNESNWQTDTMYNTTMCIEKKLVIKVENVVTVYFDFDKHAIKERGTAQLDSIYNILINDTTFTIQISGYTDGRGTVEYNKILSDKRAKACADYLIEKGLDPTRISFFSFGACCPVEMELINGRDNPDGRSMNRRALINISKE